MTTLRVMNLCVQLKRFSMHCTSTEGVAILLQIDDVSSILLFETAYKTTHLNFEYFNLHFKFHMLIFERTC